MNRTYVTRIESNVKGGVDIDLSPRTLIVGPNGSGKSAIINSVELALTGRVSDLAGRAEVSREADVMQLAPGREGRLFAVARFSDGSTAEYATEGSTAKAKKATRRATGAIAENVFPLRDVMAAVKGSSDTARKFFLQRVAGSVTAETIEALMSGALLPLYKKAVVGSLVTANPIDKLLTAREFSGKQAREAKARIKAGAEASAAASSGLAPPPTSQEIEDAEKHVSNLRETISKLDKAESLSQVRVQLSQAEENVVRLSAARDAAKAEWESLPAHVAIPKLKQLSIDALHAHAESGASSCLVCNFAAGTEVFQKRSAATKQLVAATIARNVAVTKAKYEVEVAQSRVDAARGTVETLKAALADVVDAPTATREDTLAKIAAGEERVTELHGLRAAWKAAQRASDVGDNGNSEAKLWGALSEACDEAIEKVLDKSVDAFRKQVQGFLPEGDDFLIRLRDGEREVFQLGFVREGVLHTALSGVEWARVTCAIAAACAPLSGPSVVIPEDRSFDPATLVQVCEALNTTDGQVIIASATEPASVPNGWTIVRTSARN